MGPDLSSLFDHLSFPLTTEQFIAAVGRREIVYPTGKVERVEEVCRRVDVDEYSSRDDAELVIRSALDGDAVGRRGYSDRDPPIPGVDRYEQVSC